MSDQVIGVTIKGIGDFSDVVSNVGNVQKALTKLKLPDKLGDGLNKNISNFMKEYDKYQKKIAEGIHTQGDQNAVNKSLNSMLNSYEKIIKDFGKISSKDFKDIFNLDEGQFASVQKRIKDIEANIKKIKLDPKQLTEPLKVFQDATKAKSLFGNGKGFDRLDQAFKNNNLEEAKQAIIEIDNYLTRFGSRMDPTKLEKLNSIFAPLKQHVLDSDNAAKVFTTDIDKLNNELSEIGGRGAQELNQLQNGLKGTDDAAKSVIAELKQIHANEFDFNRQAADIDRQIQSYFGLSQMIRKVGDIARDAFATVKELDAAMTQTAVVTNFDVGDMWDMLPTYTAQANQLGSTIKDVYEAATLYYQQGLNTNQAMGLANETLKMARIAGLDAAEATNMMTAALRGFNMEINQASAQKINDIYSELAAITASDTKEIGSAMERTASIANAANMDFATTSAFLAQMIETTREAPENLGTAMKTIVARFQEMKQDPTKLVDSEGVAMDVNKVDKALKTIGVSLTNTKGEFRDLDDVFLDISSKWDSLSQGQQRYIATIAAGSRQQSRFIAMMSDYERTMELVDAANNSAGASQRQFEKTLDSMEAKLNMLKNAWDQFTMGLMNNQILKFGVDALTEGFTIVNKFIDILGKLPPKPFEGITKSVLTLVTTLGMLNFGKKASRGLIMGGAGWWKGETSLAGGFVEGWKSSGQAGFLKNRKTTAEAEQQGNKDGQAYGKGWTKAIQVLQNQRRGEILGVGQIELNKIQALPVGSIIEKLLPKEAISAEAAQQLQESIDAAGGNVHQGLVDYKHATGKGKILDVNQGKQLQAAYDSNKIKQLETNFNSLTGTIGTAGSALMNFGMVLQGTPLEPFGQILTTIGGSLMSLSTAITAVKTGFLEQWAAATEAALGTTVAAGANGELAISSIVAAGGMKVLGTAIWTALWPLLAVAAAIGAVVLVAKGLDAAIETNKEQLEAASDAAAAASEAYDSAKQETSELADSIDTIRETDSVFDGLVAGTAEFNEQLVTANEQIMALIDKYPMLNDSQYLSTDKNGLMHINEAGFKAVQEYQKQIQARASAMNLIQTADLNALENQQKAQQLRNSIKTNMSDDEQERILKTADLLEQRAKAETKLAQLNAIRTNLVGKEIADQEKLASIYADQYEAKKQVAEAEVEVMGKHDIRQAYADYHGYIYDKSTKKIKDVEGNEIDYDDTAIKDEVIEQTVMLDFEANASSLEGILHSLDRDFSKTLDGVFENSSTFISDVLSNNIEANEDLLQQVLDNPKQLNDFVEELSTKELAAVLGASEEAVESNVGIYKQQLEDKLLTNAQNIIDTNAQANGELAAMLAQAQSKSANEVLISKNIQEGLIQQVKNFTAEQRNTLLNIGKILEESAGSEAMTTFVNGLSNIYQTGSEELKTATQDWVDGVNWETATGRLKGYNEAINMTADDTKNLGEEGVKQINDLGKALLESQDEANLLGEAFEEFYNSTDFQEMAENMDKFVDSSGQLNAASVMDMAEECHSLNNLLDTGAISAGGVAAALNALGSSGDLVLSDLNSKVLELLSNFGQLDDIIASSHRNIENFDWGIDTGEAEDFVQESAKKWNELYDNGEVGNPQMEAYAKWVMGEDKYIALLAEKHGDLKETMDDVAKYVNKYSDGFEEAWDDLASGKWEIDEKDLSDNLKDLGISASFNDDGSWHWEPGKATTAELQQWLQEVKQIGPELAQAMIEDWSNYSPNFRAERQKNDFAAGLDSYAAQRRGANGEIAITASELNTIAASTGQEIEDVKAAIIERAGIDENQLNVLQNIKENTGEYVTDGAVLNKELTKAMGANGQNGWLTAYQARDSAGNLMKNTIDIESAMAAAVERGYTAAQAKSMAYESYTNAAQQGKDYYYKGELLEADQYKTLDQFATRLEEIDQNEQWTTVGQAIADGFLNRMEALNKPEESALTEEKSEEPSTSNIPQGTTIPGVGYVTADGKVPSRELTWEDRVPGWVSNLIHALENHQPAEEPKEKAHEDAPAANKAFMDWFLGKNSEGASETQSSLQEAGSKLQEGSTQITNAASKLEGAASKLDGAANTLQNSNNSSTSSIPKGTTIPGVGFVESSTQTTDVNYDVKVANGDEIRASVQEQLATILKSVTTVAQQAQASASIKINYARGKQAKASDQSAKVNYKKGTQDKAEDKEAKVNYILGSQALPTSPKSATVNYLIGSQEDPKDKTAYVTYKRKPGTLNPDDEQATGSHNHGYAPAPSFGSAAKGYGQVGPKGKGGLTLTGELGYEIAWIPSENRSMILGANGPQMVNLPGDAVVWTHEQSKKILKQKAIPAGSHSDRPKKTTITTPTTTTTTTTTTTDSHTKALQKQQQQNADEAEKIIKKAGKVTVWWENQTRKVDAIHRKAEKSLNNFNTLIKNGTLSMAEIKPKVGNAYEKQLKSSMAADKKSYTRASAELDILDKGSGKGKAKTTYKTLGKGSKDKAGVKALQEALNKAGYSVGKDGIFGSQTAAALKKFQKANNLKVTGKTNKATIQALDKVKGVSVSGLKSTSSKGKKLIENGGSWANISYQVSKKDKNGKTKKESKETKVDLSKYIKYNKKTDTYEINQKKLDEVGLGKTKYKKGSNSKKAQARLKKATNVLEQAKKSGNKKTIKKAQKEYDEAEKNAQKYRYKTKGNKSKAEAIKNAAESEINKRVQRQNKAEDDWIKDYKAAVDYENQMMDAFHGWKNELTEIYAITTDIAATESKIGLARAQNDYAKTQIDLLDLTKGLSAVSGKLGKSLKQIGLAYENENDLLTQNIKQLKDKRDANKTEIYQALHLNNIEKEGLKKAKEAEKGVTIGSTKVYTDLSETAKNAYAKDLLINGGFLKESETNPGMHIFDADAVQKAIENNEITGELGGRLKSMFDVIAEAEQNGLDIETELANKQTEKLKLQEEEKQYYKDIANQLFGWKNELTELLEITNKLKQATVNQDYLKSAQDFLQAQMQAGFEVSTRQIMTTFKGALDSSIATIQTTQAAIIRQEEQMQKDLTGNDLVKDLEAIDNLIANDTEGNMNVLLAQRQNVLDEIKAAKLVRRNTYGTVTKNADGTLNIDYNQDAIESAVRRGDLTESVGQELVEYYQTLEADSEEYKKLQQDLLKNVTDVYKELGEIQKQYVDAAKSLREAYIQQQQEQIDKLKSLNNSVNNHLKNILDKVQQSINQRREAEDNAKTEEDLAKKQRRLAMMRGATGGGNAVEAAQLQQELTEGQRDYKRTLEDQLLNKLSLQNDAAAQERQRQTQILQAQHEVAKLNGTYARTIDEWLEAPDQFKTQITDVLTNAEGLTALTAAEQEAIKNQIGEQMTTIQTAPAKIAALQNAIDGEGGLQEAVNQVNTDISNSIATASSYITDDGPNSIKNAKEGLISALGADTVSLVDIKAAIEQQKTLEKEQADAEEKAQQEEEARKQTQTDYDNFLIARGSATNSGDENWSKIGHKGLKKQVSRGQDLGYSLSKIFGDLGGTEALTWKEVIKAARDANYSLADLKQIRDESNWSAKRKNAFGKAVNEIYKDVIKTKFKTNYKYASGGLANFTGPAWLDGTPSKPELVLNAKDTNNFLALRDVLSKALNSTNLSDNSSNGDVLYEININVDKIEKDYDVDRVVEKVKKEIVKGAGYRNVTQVRNFR